MCDPIIRAVSYMWDTDIVYWGLIDLNIDSDNSAEKGKHTGNVVALHVSVAVVIFAKPLAVFVTQRRVGTGAAPSEHRIAHSAQSE